jgi:hypothetical protein
VRLLRRTILKIPDYMADSLPTKKNRSDMPIKTREPSCFTDPAPTGTI